MNKFLLSFLPLSNIYTKNWLDIYRHFDLIFYRIPIFIKFSQYEKLNFRQNYLLT